MDTTLIISVLSLLAAGNIYFIKRLVEKIDKIESSFAASIPKLQEKMDNLEKQLEVYSKDLREIADLKREVAVLNEKMKHMEKNQ